MAYSTSAEGKAALAAVELQTIKKTLAAESWNDDIEDLMKAWGEKAAGLRWMHQNAAGGWKKLADRLGLWGIGITGLSSTAALVTAGIEDVEWLGYIVGSVGMFAAMLQSLKKFYNAEEKAADHASIAKKFGSFYRSMTIELGTPRSDRRPSDIVAGWAANEFNNLQAEAPNIGGGVVSSFKANFSQAENIPDIAEDEFVIHIHGRDKKATTDPDGVIVNA